MASAYGRILGRSRSSMAWISPTIQRKKETKTLGIKLMHQQRGFTTSLFGSARSWNAGDAVLVRMTDKLDDQKSSNDTASDMLVPGTINENRGRGWYTVSLLSDQNENLNTTITVRSTQLRFADTSPYSTTTTSQNNDSDKMTQSSSLLQQQEQQLPPQPPPPPMIIDLDQLLQTADKDKPVNLHDQSKLKQVAHHATVKRWVVFTDLHCSPASLETCLQILTKVHDIAIERNAGVLFLGDFWHHRGSLRVDCLNAVLEHFEQTWSVPMIMIPGNHDQVTLGGHNHSLLPLQNSYRVNNTDIPGPLIFSHPTRFCNALFVPHIRDMGIMESVLSSSDSIGSDALFVHADVKGAYMNDMMVSLHGISPAVFPQNKRIYSGHFHKPHVVHSGSVSIEYLGSPYETTLSEAQQLKSLVVIDASNGWQCMDYIPLDIGPKHYRVSSWDDLMQIKTSNVNESAGTVKSGDRIVVTLPKDESKTKFENMNGLSSLDHVNELRKNGVTVEIREVKTIPTARMGQTDANNETSSLLEDLSPLSTWNSFLKDSVERNVTSEAQAEILLKAGEEIIQSLESNDGYAASDHSSTTKTSLHLTSLTLEGFGPFHKSATYPLANRGLVLLRGRNNDGGSDSNGSGKSSLAMAALWAFTGSLDPRKAQDGKVSDVINDDSKIARVSVNGTLNNIPFVISRTKTERSSDLTFNFDNVDMTTQSVKETQSLIEEKIGTTPQILLRTIFHGQHTMNELLEATDAKFKDELSVVVPLWIWQEAATLSRSKSRVSSNKVSELKGKIALRTDDLDDLRNRLQDAEDDVEAKTRQSQELEQSMKGEREQLEEVKVSESFGDIDSTSLEVLDQRLQDVSAQVKQLESSYNDALMQQTQELKPAQKRYDDCLAVLTSVEITCQTRQREADSTRMKLDGCNDQLTLLEEKWDVSLSNGLPDSFVVSTTCPTCLQPVNNNDESNHSHESLQSRAEKEINNAIEKATVAKSHLESAIRNQADADKSRLVAEEHMHNAKTELDQIVQKWTKEIEKIKVELGANRQEQDKVSNLLSNAARQARRDAAIRDLESKLNAAQAALDYSKSHCQSISKNIANVESNLKLLKSDTEAENRIVQTMSDLATLFGQRGVQTFVLQNAVDSLQSLSQNYLDALSDGSLQIQLTLDAGDRISRTALVRSANGEFKERPLSSLSGGQWRRCSIALTLGFAELVARRGKMRSSLIVLDEPLTHLDRAGRSDVGSVLRKLLYPADTPDSIGTGSLGLSTVLLILQDLAAEELEEAFDCIDEVVKEGSSSFVKIDEYS